MLTCRWGIAWCRAPSAQNRLLLHQWRRTASNWALSRACYLWWAAVGGNTNHGGQTPSCTHCVCWNFSPPAGQVPLSPLPAVLTFWETTNNSLDLLMLICVLLSQLHEFAVRCMGQTGVFLAHLCFVNYKQYQRALRTAYGVWKLVFRWHCI